jgi:signal peptidase I
VERFLRNIPQPWRSALDWLLTIGGAIAIVLAIKAWVANPYRIPTSSMEPTLHCARPAQGCEAKTSDRVLANRFIYHLRDPKRGEIVVFHTPKLALQACGSKGTFVKRLIGLPGDVWRQQNGFVYINGKRLREPYVKFERRDTLTLTLRDIPPAGRYTGMIPQGYYLMMGDNRKESCDSRRFGLVPRASLIGPVFAIYWPLSRASSGLWYVALTLASLSAAAYLLVRTLSPRKTPGTTHCLCPSRVIRSDRPSR